MTSDYSKYWKQQTDKFWNDYAAYSPDESDPFDKIHKDLNDAYIKQYDEYIKKYKDYGKQPQSPVKDKIPSAPKKQRLVTYIIIPVGTSVEAIPRDIKFGIGGGIITHQKTVTTTIKIEKPSNVTSQGYYYIELNTPDWIAYLVAKRNVTEGEELVDE